MSSITKVLYFFEHVLCMLINIWFHILKKILVFCTITESYRSNITDFIIIIINILIIMPLATGLFFLLLLPLKQRLSPPLRLQVPHCSTLWSQPFPSSHSP
jgi:hypothetical protein